MAFIKDRTKNLRTVGDVIDALSKFDLDMRITSGLDEVIEVYRAEPEEHEFYEDDRGEICIQGHEVE